MLKSHLPFSRDLVLIGGGHAHSLVLRKWAMAPLPGVRLTLISPSATALYSGMLPGFIAGHYKRQDLDIDLVRLSRSAGARILFGAATGIDTRTKLISVSGHPPIAYDLASLDIGITSRMPSLSGFREFATPAKPLDQFATCWQRFLKQTGQANVAVLGGGVAGVEIAMAFAFALKRRGRSAKIHLLDRQSVLAGVPTRTRQRLLAALKSHSVELHENVTVTEITRDGIVLREANFVPASFVCGAAGGHPHDWLSSVGLKMQDGFVCVSEYLQTSDPSVFAVGDCAHMTKSPRPKAGVFAVRQAEVLFKNLRNCLTETGKLSAYHPQNDYLKLISLGKKSALGDRFGLTFQGPAVWKWKDHIDQSFMDKFRNLPAMKPSPRPKEYAADALDVLGDAQMCGGCGSKVGRSALQSAMKRIVRPDASNIRYLPGDDSALLLTGSAQQVISTDHLRAFSNDPIIMTRIAANHALGDIWAMGARPQAATATVIIPSMSSKLAERTLSEIMVTAQEVFTKAGATVVGGHSSQGGELTVGFTVTGLCDDPPITLTGARPGDPLILTKPLGTGVLMAAEMAGTARGIWIKNALDQMTMPQDLAATILAKANAMTDVTGFGLAGHLLNICLASQVGAVLNTAAIPLLPGALPLSEQGVKSTLYPENRRSLTHIAQTPRNDLLFDPQTSGGLLASVSGETDTLLTQLKKAGFEAAVIGQMTANIGHIEIA